MAGARPPRIRYTHEGLIDMIIAEPWVSQNELAMRFGYTAPWISTVMTSDAFLAKLEERKAERRRPVPKPPAVKSRSAAPSPAVLEQAAA